MDALSRILDSLEWVGSLYFTTEFCAPYALQVPEQAAVCRFHAVVQGRCWIGLPDGNRTELARGDLVLVPHGSAHTLSSDPDSMSIPLEEALSTSEVTPEGCFRWGGTGACCRLVCGHFAFDPVTAKPIFSSLPGLIHIQATAGYDYSWLENVTRFLGAEASSGRPGSGAISKRLSEVLFIQALRQHATAHPQSLPVLAGLSHAQLGRALQAMHEDPGQTWSLEALAQRAGMSRTSFASSSRAPLVKLRADT